MFLKSIIKNTLGVKLSYDDLMSFIGDMIEKPPILKTEWGELFIDDERFEEPIINVWQRNFKREIEAISNQDSRKKQREYCYDLIFDSLRMILIHRVKSKVKYDESWYWCVKDHPQFTAKERPREVLNISFDIIWLGDLCDNSLLKVLASKFFELNEEIELCLNFYEELYYNFRER